MQSDDQTYRQRYLWLALLALTAAGLAGWIRYLSAAKLNLPGCGGDSGCASVIYTRWGRWFGVPVSFLGTAAYLSASVLSLIPSGEEGSRRRRAVLLANGALAVAIGLAILWFVALQIFAIRAICTYCLASHALGVVVVILLLQRHSLEAPHAEDWSWGHRIALIIAGCAAFAVLRAGQLSSPPPQTHALVHYDYAGGQIEFTNADALVLGRAEAPHVALELFDYTCDSCRQLAPQLTEAIDRYNGQFAVLLIPCPIERKSNPHLLPGAVEHPDGCEYARCAMAVWIAAPETFHEYHDWLILSESIPTLAEARERAAELVGSEAYEQAYADQRIDELIARGVDLYRGMQRGVMSKLRLGERMIKGAPRYAYDLFRELEKLLPLEPVNLNLPGDCSVSQILPWFALARKQRWRPTSKITLR